MQQKPTSAFQELERGAKYVEYRTRGLRQTMSNVFFTPEPQSETDRFMHDYENKQPFNSVVVAEDVDGWEELTDAALKVATDGDQSKFKPTPDPGPVQQTAGKLKEKAIEAAFEALDITGQYLTEGMELVASEMGLLIHTNTAEALVEGIVRRHPYLKNIKSAFIRGGDEELRRRRRSNCAYGRIRTHLPDPRITHPDDAPEGSNLDMLPIICTPGVRTDKLSRYPPYHTSAKVGSDQASSLTKRVPRAPTQDQFVGFEDVPLEEDDTPFKVTAEGKAARLMPRADTVPRLPRNDQFPDSDEAPLEEDEVVYDLGKIMLKEYAKRQKAT